MVLLSGRGHSVPQIAAIHGCGHDVVRTWLHRYRARGVAGLADLPRSGRPPTDRLARQIVDAQASQSPRCAGLVQACWTVALLAAFLAARFGLALSGSTVRRHLKATGWRWRRPRLAPASTLPHKRDPDAAAKERASAAALRRARRGACRLLFLDECDLHLLPVLRACWMRGPRLRVPTPGTNAKRAFFGALGRGQRRLPHRRPRPQARRPLRRLPPAAGRHLPDRAARAGDGQRPDPRRQGRARLAGAPTRA